MMIFFAYFGQNCHIFNFFTGQMRGFTGCWRDNMIFVSGFGQIF